MTKNTASGLSVSDKEKSSNNIDPRFLGKNVQQLNGRSVKRPSLRPVEKPAPNSTSAKLVHQRVFRKFEIDILIYFKISELCITIITML
jgi:hypothetical protein